jgi:hypothetical protein
MADAKLLKKAQRAIKGRKNMPAKSMQRKSVSIKEKINRHINPIANYFCSVIFGLAFWEKSTNLIFLVLCNLSLRDLLSLILIKLFVYLSLKGYGKFLILRKEINRLIGSFMSNTFHESFFPNFRLHIRNLKIKFSIY